ncbi:ABC transporter permease [Allopusillimonas soli]|uniref:ABC transporter permease n=2 Tax=Allopusillimonas soli TaxID=659016 RepID=A0A853FH84_9BURK|nr:ABC transporter permease [Allopusillimonas soli]TEA69600.1 ABC transporter permease [Allopusillimonas soli]
MSWRMIRWTTMAVYLFMFLPIGAVILLSFSPEQFGGLPTHTFSLRWYDALRDNQAIRAAAHTSLVLGAQAAIIASVLGVLASMAMMRFNFRGKQFINAILVMPILIPEVVLGVALLLFLRWASVQRSYALLLMGHVLITLPFVILVVQARLAGLRHDYEEAARSLGANAIQTFFTVTLPLIMPAVLAGMVFAFTISFDDITATLFWKSAGVETVPTQIFAMLRNSISPQINALGTLMIVLTVGLPICAGLLARCFKRGRA